MPEQWPKGAIDRIEELQAQVSTLLGENQSLKARASVAPGGQDFGVQRSMQQLQDQNRRLREENAALRAQIEAAGGRAHKTPLQKALSSEPGEAPSWLEL